MDSGAGVLAGSVSEWVDTERLCVRRGADDAAASPAMLLGSAAPEHGLAWAAFPLDAAVVTDAMCVLVMGATR
jgi:hypothetical protein